MQVILRVPQGKHSAPAGAFEFRPACSLVGWDSRNRSATLRFFYARATAGRQV